MTSTAYIIETSTDGTFRVERTSTGLTTWVYVDGLEVGRVTQYRSTYVAESFDPADIEEGCARCGFTNRDAAVNFLSSRHGFLYPADVACDR